MFELALEGNALDAVKADLDRFDALIAENPDLLRLVRSPVFGADEQDKALTAILEKAGIKGLSASFLLAVTANRRLFAVRQILSVLGTLVLPTQFGLARAAEAFDPDGRLKDPAQQKSVDAVARELVSLLSRLMA